MKAHDGDSQHGAVQLTSAPRRFDASGRCRSSSRPVSYTDAPTLAALVKSGRLFLVEVIAVALDEVDVVTIAPGADMTTRGIRARFEPSEPVINVLQAEKRNVSMPAEVLKLMTVYR